MRRTVVCLPLSSYILENMLQRFSVNAAGRGGGVIAGASAFLLWGMLPVYWRALRPLPAPHILAHRILWAGVSVVLLTTVLRGWKPIVQTLKARRARWLAAASACALTANWLTYIWAVNAGFVLETSLGYFIAPLTSITLGTLVLGEPLRPWQRLAILLALLGVVAMSALYGEIPWIGLAVAITFSLYGLCRKVSALSSLQGLVVETLFLTPFALAYLFWQRAGGAAFFGEGGWGTTALLVACGPISAVPLLLFATAARLLPLSTVGMLQYLSPTCGLLLAVLAFGEPLTRAHEVGFIFIWTALIIYTGEAWWTTRRARLTTAASRG